jgi:3-dehydroquinate dehydratase / shikimate dehydrogenase
MMVAEHKHLAENGAQLVELRVDYIRRAVGLKRLLAERPCPAVIACRRPKDGGKWRMTEADRVILLRTAIAEGADYVDIEEDIAGQIPRFGKTKRIISYHNFHETPNDIEQIRDRMLRLDPDIIKIATTANRPHDNTRVLRLIKGAKVPTVAFCMGEMGVPSRILCKRFGSPFTYASFHSERILAPGQLSYTEMLERYHFDSINSETVVLGVIADPVAQSLSPLIHNANIRKLGVNMVYLPFRVPRDELESFINDCPELSITGLSVTIPHKESVLRSINALDEDVAGIRAANTLVFKGSSIYGFNTDCRAAMISLSRADEREGIEVSKEKPFAGRRALVLGSGGAAKAMTFGLIRGGATVMICSRNTRKAEQMAMHFGCSTADWMARNSIETDYIINCTPMGMFPDMDESPIERDSLKSDMIVFDTVYNPEQTLLVKYAREAGVDMFVRQAAMQFKLFTGQDADVGLMRAEIKRAISAARY